MHIVIDIDEEDFEIMKHNIAANNPLCPLSQEEMVSKIANGIPLPKGHGDLIDKKVAYKKFYARCLAGAASDVFAETPTIVPADKEYEDKVSSRNEV